MFKKDDYIVLLKYKDARDSGSSSYILNHCYKQRENKDYLLTYLDSKGSTSNGWTWFPFNEPDNWRYATREEAAEYERLGKPYDITTLICETDKISCILSEGDEVVFEGPKGRRKYIVRSQYLTTVDVYGNDIIFIDLGLDKEEFCEKYYGYRGSNGDWPEYKSGDFKALTRVVDALHEECKKAKKKVTSDILKEGDVVEFDTSEGILKYIVRNSFLSDCDFGHNGRIFDILGIDKRKVASTLYGYDANSGEWPRYKYNDFEAATRLVNHLHELCRKTLLTSPPPKYVSVDLGFDVGFGLTVTDHPSITESITHFEYRRPASHRRGRISFNPPSHEMWYRPAIDFSFDTSTSKSESKDLETPNKLIKLPFTEI